MSILLKALEKSEKAKKEKAHEAAVAAEAAEAVSHIAQADKPVSGDGHVIESAAPKAAPTVAPKPAATAAAPKPAGGGFKIGGGEKKSTFKLGADKSAKTAGRVVAAYESSGDDGGEDHHAASAHHDDEHHELVRASRKARNKRLGTVLLLAIVAGGGFFVYEEFGRQFIESQLGDRKTATITEDFAAVQSADDATLLPLPEPIYDIQESILIASLSAEEVENVDVTNLTQERELADRVTEVVSSIIEDQLEEERQRELLASIEENAAEEENEDVDEVERILTEEFDASTALQINSRDVMNDRLDTLAKPFVSRNKKQFIVPTGFDLAQVDEDGNIIESAAPAATEEDGPSQDTESEETAAPESDLRVVKNDKNLKEELAKGVRSYQLGDLNEAEKSFRTIIAAEPDNVSALIGLAKIHQSRGNSKLAVATLLKASELEPDNPTIVGELLSIQTDTVETSVSESKLISMLSAARDPKVEAKIFFILGNVYAKDSDWLQAKRAFLGAHQLNGENPDYAYNLAVIHDYLAEDAQAVKMYQHALDKARANPSSFDQVSAKARLETLK